MILVFVSAVDLCSLCSDESSHPGHWSDSAEQHLTRSLDRSTRAEEDLVNH